MSYQAYMDQYDKIGYSANGILQFKNFLSSEDLNSLVSYLDTYDGVGQIQQQDISDSNTLNILQDADSRIHSLVMSEIANKYDIPIKADAQIPLHLQKWGDHVNGLGVHSDSEDSNRNPVIAGEFYRSNITALIYLTDDYSGGEIVFPEFNKAIKPDANELIIFPGRYRHYVKRFSGGRRYTAPAWYEFDLPLLEHKEIDADHLHNPSLYIFEGYENYPIDL